MRWLGCASDSNKREALALIRRPNHRTYSAMAIEIDDWVMHPAYAPYPRYGRVVQREDAEHVRVTQVHCGDPRCNAEHAHADQVWAAAELRTVNAYQPRARWELGRKNSPNAAVFA